MRSSLFIAATTAAAASTSWEALAHRVATHVHTARRAAHQLFLDICDPERALGDMLPDYSRAEVNVPSCEGLHASGLESYYGNLHILLSEAWEAKILASLRALTRKGSASQLRAELVTVHGDDTLAGAIFVEQLLVRGMPSRAALMIGIHRMPRHKAMRQLQGRLPSLNVTVALVEAVRAWCLGEPDIDTLLVCPYGGIEGRLLEMGFATVPSMRYHDHTLADQSLTTDVCEESSLLEDRVYAGEKSMLIELHGEDDPREL